MEAGSIWQNQVSHSGAEWVNILFLFFHFLFWIVDDQRKAKPTWKVIQELCNEEGVTTLYRGLLPVLSSLYCSNFVYFYTFHGLKKLLIVRSLKPSPTTDLLLGYFAGFYIIFIENHCLICWPIKKTRLFLNFFVLPHNLSEIASCLLCLKSWW